MSLSELIRIQVQGAYACFSRPEFKAERVSYPVMTRPPHAGWLKQFSGSPSFAIKFVA